MQSPPGLEPSPEVLERQPAVHALDHPRVGVTHYRRDELGRGAGGPEPGGGALAADHENERYLKLADAIARQAPDDLALLFPEKEGGLFFGADALKAWIRRRRAARMRRPRDPRATRENRSTLRGGKMTGPRAIDKLAST